MVNKQIGKPALSVEKARAIWDSNPQLLKEQDAPKVQTSEKIRWERYVFFLIGLIIGAAMYFASTRI
jgi:hypothetical protein